jgi:hypothetical protein
VFNFLRSKIMGISQNYLLRSIATFFLICLSSIYVAAADKSSLHHVKADACKQCHEEIYEQWQGSVHAHSSALRDPIHGAFYLETVGDPTQEGVKIKGKFPVCLKCHAPIAAVDKTTKLDSAEAYASGVNCVSCHTFSSFKGIDGPNGKPQYGADAYVVDGNALHGPSGNTYTTERVSEGATWPTPIHHPQPLQGNNAALFQSNDVCMGCHHKRDNFFGVSLCNTGLEYQAADGKVNCQSCHMAVVKVPKLKDGQVVPGQFIDIADHRMGGGHDQRMVARGLALELKTTTTEQTITATVTLRNRLPHAYPTGAPFRSLIIKVAAYDAAGMELWKNYKTHPMKDDPKSALWYTMGDKGKPSAPHVATEILADTRLKPNEVRELVYEIPRTPVTAIVRVEALYDLLLPPIKAMVKGKIDNELLRPKLAAAAEVRL